MTKCERSLCINFGEQIWTQDTYACTKGLLQDKLKEKGLTLHNLGRGVFGGGGAGAENDRRWICPEHFKSIVRLPGCQSFTLPTRACPEGRLHLAEVSHPRNARSMGRNRGLCEVGLWVTKVCVLGGGGVRDRAPEYGPVYAP